MSDDSGGNGGVGQRSHTAVLQVGVALDEHPLQRSLHVVHRGSAPLHSLQQSIFFVFPLLCFGEGPRGASTAAPAATRATSMPPEGTLSLCVRVTT
jgi:hypothetical protein